MRIRSAATEAWRNLTSGATALWLLVPAALVLTATINALATIETRGTLISIREQQVAGSYALAVRGDIDDSLCNRMATSDRFIASGATNSPEVFPILALPDSPPSHLEVTPAAAQRFFNIDPTSIGTGIYLTDELATELGHPTSLDTPDGTLPVAGLANPTADVSSLRRLVVSVVATIDEAKQCFVDRFPPSPDDQALVAPTLTSVDGARITQLHQDLGPPLNAHAELTSATTKPLVHFLPLGIAALTATAVSLRRRELSILRQLGYARSDVALIHGIETTAALIAAAALSAPLIVALATQGTTEAEAHYLLQITARTTSISAIAGIATAALSAALTSPRRVLKNLKDT